MNENRVEGAAKVVGGRFKRAAGELLEDNELKIRGGVQEGVGHAQEAAGTAQDILEETLAHVKTAAGTTAKIYGDLTQFGRDVAKTIDERSFLSVGVAAGVGLLVGLLIAGRGPKIVYVNPKT